MIAGYAALLH